MKNYFNAKERANHIILLGTEQIADNLLETNALTSEEERALKLCKKHIQNFHKLVFERFGEPYKKKIQNTMAINELGLYSKYAEKKDCLSYCASEDVYELAKILRGIRCLDCEKSNHKDCAIYSILCSVDGEVNENESGCPYEF